MKRRIYNSLIAFAGGLFGVSTLFIIFYLIFDVAHFENPFPPTFLGIFFSILLLNSFIEEGTKFLLIKKSIGAWPYGFFLGFGFGTGEIFYRLYEGRIASYGAILLHILTAGIICFSVKQNRPALGLGLAIILHTAYNLFAQFLLDI